MVFEDIIDRKDVPSDVQIILKQFSQTVDTFLKMANNLNDGLTIIENEEIVYVNDRFCEITGYSQEEIKKLFNRYIGSKERENPLYLIWAPFDEQTREPSTREFKIIRKNGLKRYISNRYSTRIQDEKVINLYIITTDITEQKEKEKEFRDLFQNLPIGMYRTSLDGKIIDANPAIIKMMGFSSFEELASKNTWTLSKEMNFDRSSFIKRMMSEKEIKGHEWKINKPNGSIVHLREHARVFQDVDGNVTGFEGAIENITEMKEAEATRLALEEKKQEFLQMVSHELRNPLNIILNYVDILSNKKEIINKELQEKDIFLIVKNQVDRITRLMDDVVDLPKIKDNEFIIKKEKVLMSTVLNQVRDQYFDLLGKQFRLEEYSEPIMIIGDKDRLVQVFSNCVENSIKFTSEKDRMITLRTELLSVDRVKLTISDNGVGIESKDLDNVFEIFFTKKTKYSRVGTGLGLFICRQIVKAHKGTIMAESKGMDKGTSIIIELPVTGNSAL